LKVATFHDFHQGRDILRRKVFVSVLALAMSWLSTGSGVQAADQIQTTPVPNPVFVREFGDTYQPQLEQWIPSYSDTYWSDHKKSDSGDWVRSPKSVIWQGDSLTLEPDPHHLFDPDRANYPKSSEFYFGQKVPNRIGILYDPAHRIAVYQLGGHAWTQTVVASRMPAPPVTRSVLKADLSGLRTHRGITLGDSTAKVMRVYGIARKLHTTGLPEYLRLSYETPINTINSPCESNDEFIFRNDSLIAIIFVWAC
jgi:hypothetical protein